MAQVTLPQERVLAQESVRTAVARLDYIDGLRGFACLYVVLYHLFLLWPVSSHDGLSGKSILIDLLTRFAAFGNIGVDVFLGLSGFCLFYPLCRKASGSDTIPTVKLPDYARRRVRRILPPYVAAVVLFSILPLWGYWAKSAYALPGVADLLTHVLLIHNLFPETVLTIDSPFWSLALEAQLYLLFPVLVILFRRLGPTRMVVLAFALSLAYRIVAWYGLGASHASFGQQFVMMNALPGRFHEFVIGMAAAYLLSRSVQSEARPVPRLRSAALLAIVAGAGLAYASDKHWGTYSPLTSLFWATLTFGLIVGAGLDGIPPLRIFRWRPLVFAGIVSYSIYLIHEPLLRVTGAYVRQLSLTPLSALALWIVLVGPLILLVSRGFFLTFERPFLKRQ